MNMTSTVPETRLARLDKLLQLDPGNLMLLADAAQAALGEGAFDAAERYLEAGRRKDASNPSWAFRLAGLRIAQRRLPQARELLGELEAAGVAPASVAHDLAYVDFLEGRLEESVLRLQPWVGAESAELPEAGALQTLWLRGLHHAQRLDEAWAWIDACKARGRLTVAAAGVASLIALDRSNVDAAAELSTMALADDPGHVEALIARGSVFMARGNLGPARAALSLAAQKAPHQARVWSSLGYVCMLELNPEAARQHFETALREIPDDPSTLQALGWACILLNDLPAASHAFEDCIAHDAEWGDAHGGLACVLALQGQTERAQEQLRQARELQRGSISARLAHSLLTGEAKGLASVQRLAQQIMAGLAAGGRGPSQG